MKAGCVPVVTEVFPAGERRKSAGRKVPVVRPRALDALRESLAIENTLSWLFVDIHRLFSKDFETRVKDLGLTRMQWRVLFSLERERDGMTQTQLADMVEIEKAPLGKMLDRVEEGGWIIRKAHPTDRRARLVYATSKIEKYADRLAAAAKGTFARMLKDVRQSDVKDLIAQLEKLKRNLGGADD